MAKIPKAPKRIPKPHTPPAPPPRARPQYPAPRPFVPPKPSDGAKRVWEERPRIADHILSEEQKRAPSYVNKVQRWRQLPIMFGGLTAFAMGLYGFQLYYSIANAEEVENLPEDFIDRFDKEADGYDEKVNMAETLLFLNKRRKDLTKKVRGHVLEVAVGTGRNIDYYPTKQCATVTLLDYSAPMLAVAKRKWKDTHPEYFSRVFFKHQSALDPITPPFDAKEGYDTVIQTMGICSTPDPVKLLHNLEAATNENGGQILLLEHGKSHYQWLNDLLDKTAPGHADAHGCFWNKDIGKIVEESGLEVVNIKRYNFGTTWWIELKPRKGMGYKRTIVDAVVGAATGEDKSSASASAVPQRPWWSLWG
ncbi:S-adenosyl-L-methionine-dependent methyltransferase [Bimuria novae-zelandiae CBS 107.79]|uniref:S-adenosyl-L-methionine-dependent methyltransferase n=1 Tax=Bimuria novae-zelandiae CBS 107.79 TaxID=1447943 RepID=A0A6A5UVY1_9PLEO|nr:S-adenosyl-L-methionine-dependent methyltransferase [Bimuria novae-zelandiae CBS 107.79]